VRRLHAKPLTQEEQPVLTPEAVEVEKPVEAVPTGAVPTAPDVHGGLWHGPQATARVVTVVAALLAFGLLGLLVGVWHLTRGRSAAGPRCRCCRRRRRLALAGTVAVAALVLTGSGMAVHQQLRDPGLPDCGHELPAAADPDHHVAVEVVGSMWLRTRQALTAPVSGLARHYVDDRGGGLCQGRSMTLAFLPSAVSDSSVAVGSVVLTGDQSSMSRGDWKALASHESRHVTQWATLTLTGGPLAMPVLYAVDEALFPQSRNHFERAAGLEDGAYPRPEGFGPRPQWTKVGVLGLLVLIVGRRRFRWASRVLVGGAAAAGACQRGLCPLHSRGWFRLPPPREARSA
jgi:hypothetical protein